MLQFIFQTITEQQRVIRKLLRRGSSSKDTKMEDNIESVSDTEDNENDSDSTLEISISVPNLSDIQTGGTVPVTTRHAVQLQRSISDTQVSKQHYGKLWSIFESQLHLFSFFYQVCNVQAFKS